MAKEKAKAVGKEKEAEEEKPLAAKAKAEDVSKEVFDAAIDEAERELRALKDLKRDKVDAERKKLPLYNYTIPYSVKINGKVWPKQGRAPKDVLEVITHAAQSKQMRRLRELVRNEYEVKSLAGGGITAQLVKTDQA